MAVGEDSLQPIGARQVRDFDQRPGGLLAAAVENERAQSDQLDMEPAELERLQPYKATNPRC